MIHDENLNKTDFISKTNKWLCVNAELVQLLTGSGLSKPTVPV